MLDNTDITYINTAESRNSFFTPVSLSADAPSNRLGDPVHKLVYPYIKFASEWIKTEPELLLR